jgi:tetraacyldisaccharide 4'-kinase
VTGLRTGKKDPLLWVIRRRLSFVDEGVRQRAEETRDEGVEPEDAPVRAEAPARPVVFCGIARPAGFVEMLRRKAVEPVETMVFEDHHAYEEEDVSRLIVAARRVRADGFVTTEKDVVKLTPAMRARMEVVGPLIVAKLELELVDEKAAVDRLITRVQVMERRKA